ncbi:hypothetical protein BDZ89DRAFT_1108361 [Hymenopellis radicata]|nr:hypothetical protein BDZ89DRAFT_1108361 [Hymenopellis radicata]
MPRKSKVSQVRIANLQKGKEADKADNAPALACEKVPASSTERALQPLNSATKRSSPEASVSKNTRQKRARTDSVASDGTKVVSGLDGLTMPRKPTPNLDLTQLKALSLKYYVCDKSNVANIRTALERLAHSLEDLRLEVVPKDDNTYHVKVDHIPKLPSLRNLQLCGSNPPDSELLPDLAVQFMGATENLRTCKIIFQEMILLQFVLTLSVVDDDITWGNWSSLDNELSARPAFERLDVEFEKWQSVHTTMKILTNHIPCLQKQGKLSMVLTGPPRPPQFDGTAQFVYSLTRLVQHIPWHIEGKLKYIGLSECAAHDLRRAHAVHPISALQVKFSPFNLHIEDREHAILKTLGITINIVVYSTLARGLVTGLYKSPDEFEAGDSGRTIPYSKELFPNSYLEETMGGLNVKLSSEEVASVTKLAVESDIPSDA